MSRPRYWRVWEAGYLAGTEAATDVLREHLQAGGQVAVVPFSGEIAIRYPNGNTAVASNIRALAKFRRRELGTRSERP